MFLECWDIALSAWVDRIYVYTTYTHDVFSKRSGYIFFVQIGTKRGKNDPWPIALPLDCCVSLLRLWHISQDSTARKGKIDHGTKTLLAVLWSLYRLAIGFHLSIVIAFLCCAAAEAIAMVYIDRLLRQRCYMWLRGLLLYAFSFCYDGDDSSGRNCIIYPNSWPHWFVAARGLLLAHLAAAASNVVPTKKCQLKASIYFFWQFWSRLC